MTKPKRPSYEELDPKDQQLVDEVLKDSGIEPEAVGAPKSKMWRHTIRIGELTQTQELYAPWVYIRDDFRHAGIEWALNAGIEDIHIDPDLNGTLHISLKVAPILGDKGANLFDVDITIEEVERE